MEVIPKDGTNMVTWMALFRLEDHVLSTKPRVNSTSMLVPGETHAASTLQRCGQNHGFATVLKQVQRQNLTKWGRRCFFVSCSENLDAIRSRRILYHVWGGWRFN